MTYWQPIAAGMADLMQGDRELETERTLRPPVYGSILAGYMLQAIPRFSTPPEAAAKLQKFTPPAFTRLRHTITAAEAEAGSVTETGPAGADSVCAGYTGEDEFGCPAFFPLGFEYDSAGGAITVTLSGESDAGAAFAAGNAAAEAGNAAPAAGTVLELYFYTDGAFDADLNITEKGILTYCVYLVWEHRFDNDAVQRALKARDSSFSTASEANHTSAGSERLRDADARLNDMMRAYADRLEYERVMAE